MSTVYVNVKSGHPVAGVIIALLSIAVSVLLTLLFGVIAGAVAGLLGLLALSLGVKARRCGRGLGAIICGVLAIVLAVTMSIGSVDMMKHLKETADKSGVAPTFSRYMNNPYFGIVGVAANASEDLKNTDTAATIQKELDALNNYANESAKASPSVG